MTIRIASAVLSLAGLIALVSGLIFWTGTALDLITLHMLMGFLAVGALGVVSVGQALAPGGSWIVAVIALVVGAATALLGMMQSSLMIGGFHWVIELIHLLLGVLTIGIGHMAAARYRRSRGQ